MNEASPDARRLDLLAVLAALIGALAWFQPAVTGSDLWWHLASGREILRAGHVLASDPFSWTFAGARWFNHEWLWDVVYWLLFRLDPQLVAWFNLALLLAVYALAYWNAWREVGTRVGAVLGVWLVSWTAHWYHDIRPHLVTLLLLGVFLATRRHRYAPLLWLGLIAIWANTHAGFAFGIGAIGLHVLVLTAERSIAARRLSIPRREWSGVAGCLVAWMVNPWGWHILSYPLAYLTRQSPYRELVEWLPPGLSANLALFNGRFSLVALLALLGAPVLFRRRPYLVLLAAVTLAMALSARRFIPLFGITAVPLIAALVAVSLQRVRGLLSPVDRPLMRLALAVAGLAAALAMTVQLRLGSQLLERWTMSMSYPDVALQFLTRADAGPRVLNSYGWGGYIALEAPRFKVFIDGRANTLYTDAIYRDYLLLLEGRPGAGAAIAKYPPADIALFPAHSTPTEVLKRLGWQVVYVDAVAMVQVPPDSPLLKRSRPELTDLSAHPQTRLRRILQAVESGGDTARAIAEVEELVHAFPLMTRAWSELAMLHALRGDAPGVRDAIARGIAVDPRFEYILRNAEARAREQLGDLPGMIVALQRSDDGGPFTTTARREVVAGRIRELEGRARAGGGP